MRGEFEDRMVIGRCACVGAVASLRYFPEWGWFATMKLGAKYQFLGGGLSPKNFPAVFGVRANEECRMTSLEEISKLMIELWGMENI